MIGDIPILDVDSIRAQFPVLRRSVHGKPLVYLDSRGNNPQAPAGHRCHRQSLFDGNRQCASSGARVERRGHRGIRGARRRIADFIHADGSNEVIFTRSATEAVNLVANTWATSTLAKGDEILITEMEHHANIVPWQLLQERIGIELKVIPIDSDGMLSLDDVRNLISDRTKLLSATWVSNATGTVNPIQDMISLAHDAGAIAMVDATQAMPHQPVDVKSLDADFIVFSGHKMYGPTGIGCLWGRESILDAMPPWQGGGDMIDQVSFEKTTFNSLPWKFEAGTPHIAGAIGLGAAVEWLSGLGMEAIAASEAVLVEKLASTLEAIPRVELIGRPTHRAAAVSFNVDGLHPHDVGTMLDQHGVAIRTGHHCAQPTMRHFNVPATARASLGVFNNDQDIEALDKALRRVIEVFG